MPVSIAQHHPDQNTSCWGVVRTRCNWSPSQWLRQHSSRRRSERERTFIHKIVMYNCGSPHSLRLPRQLDPRRALNGLILTTTSAFSFQIPDQQDTSHLADPFHSAILTSHVPHETHCLNSAILLWRKKDEGLKRRAVVPPLQRCSCKRSKQFHEAGIQCLSRSLSRT